MSSKQKARRKEKTPQPASPQRWSVRDTAIIAVVAAVGVLFGAGWWNFSHRARENPVTAAPVAAPAQDRSELNPVPSAESPASQPDFSKLQGQWVRADGGYIIDIQSIDQHGTMVAAYLNPKSIHVAKAQAARDGAALKVFIELQDVNYPGSTYDLTYDAAGDKLAGEYFQAVEQQRFAVSFERKP